MRATIGLALIFVTLTAHAGAPFDKMYGTYSVQSCADKSSDEKEFHLCGYEEFVIYADKNLPGVGIQSLRKHTPEGGIQSAMGVIQNQILSLPGVSYQEVGNVSASLVEDYSGYKTKTSSEFTLKRISGTQYLLIIKNMANIDAPGAYNFDYAFEMVLNKRD